MATRGSYVHISMGIILGGIPIMLVLCNFLRKLIVSNKKIHRALRTRTTLMNNTHQRNFSFSPFTKTIMNGVSSKTYQKFFFSSTFVYAYILRETHKIRDILWQNLNHLLQVNICYVPVWCNKYLFMLNLQFKKIVKLQFNLYRMVWCYASDSPYKEYYILLKKLIKYL